MKIKPKIPVCKQCGEPLYTEEKFFYDGRKKYCDVCAEDRKREMDAERMRLQRVARRDERTKKIEKLESENFELKAKIESLITENNLLRMTLIGQREGLR